MTKPEESVEAGRESVVQRRRGKWTAQRRRRIVVDSRVAGASVQEVAERHGVRPNLLSAWRRQDDASRMTKPVKFAAVKLSAAPADGSITTAIFDRSGTGTPYKSSPGQPRCYYRSLKYRS
jgi:Transposase